MKTSSRGIFGLILHEAIVPGPYLDSVGVWSYGVGHTASAGDPDPKHLPKGMPTDLQAELRQVIRTFRADLPRYEAGVRSAVKVPLKQHEFDALVSFHFNTGAIARANLIKRLNAGDRPGAAAGFMGWLKPAEIRSRREAEQRLFRDGIYPAGKVPVWQVDRSGRVIWKPIQQLAEADVMQLMGAA